MDKELSFHITNLAEAFTLLSSHPDELTTNKLIVIKSSFEQLTNFAGPPLSVVQIHRIAEHLIALTRIPDYTPTTFDTPIPLRLDAMLDRLAEQAPAFLSPLLQNWCEWFGLHPDPNLLPAWDQFKVGYTADQGGLSQLPSNLVKHNLVCTDGEFLYTPLPVAVAMTSETRPPNWEMISGLLHNLRHNLLRRSSTEWMRQAYHAITAFLRTSHPTLDSHRQRITRARGELVDLTRCDWTVEISPPILDAVLVALEALYQSDDDRYRAILNRVHGSIWHIVGDACNELKKIQLRAPDVHVVVDSTNYTRSCHQVSEQLKSVAEAYAVLTELEVNLGVDRYLGGQALGDDLSLVHDAVRQIGQRTHQALDIGRQVYLRQWNLTGIASLILRLLDVPCRASSLSDHFPNDRQRVIFLLVDALGYTQFQWFLNTVGRRTTAPLASNIFVWLRDQNAYNDSYLLASNLTTITGSCLPTVYTGALPQQTGIIGSRMIMEGHELNVLVGRDERHNLNDHEVASIYQRNVNQALVPFAQIASECGVDVRAWHGGSMSFTPLADLTYGSIRLAGRARRVHPEDRIFAESLPTVISWADAPEQKHLALLYYPLIDHSGHGSGPYTQFQAAELSKFNFIFTHFLVDLLARAEKLFDGLTSVVITADHGMFESSRTAISHHTVRRALGGKSACSGMRFVYDNRAMYIYGVSDSDLESTRQRLLDFAKKSQLPIDVLARNDLLVKDILCDPRSPWATNCPDLILQFHGPGIFYYKEELPPHMFFYGAHGGLSVEETFVPLIHFTLSPDLAIKLRSFF